MKKHQITLILLAAIFLAAICFLGFGVQREQFVLLMTTFAILFVCYFVFIKLPSNLLIQLLTVAFVGRVIIVFSFPELSDDIYRFLWDGMLITNGENPFNFLPSYTIENGQANSKHAQLLFEKMNSPDYFTIYPPVCQAIFAIAAFIGGNNLYVSMLVIKLFILAAEVGTIYFLICLLKKFNKPKKLVLLYALNPLVIVELSGNLHFEAIMIFFLVLALWLLTQKKLLQSALFFAFSICTKLIPLMFLPLLWKYLGWKKSIHYWAIVGVGCVLLFLPFVNAQLLQNFGNSLDLYFQKFEFNASIYYLVRAVGEWVTGYNIIQKAGPILSLIAGASILLIGFLNKSKRVDRLPALMILSLTIYLFFTTTVHPWYICTLVALAPLTQFRFVIVWSGMALLSYYAYSNSNFSENMSLIALEYVVVVIYLILETGIVGNRWRKYSIK